MLVALRLRPFQQPVKHLTLNPKNGYVKQSQIDQISKKYNPTISNWQKLRMYAAIFSHIGVEGFKGLRQDFVLYNQLKKKQSLTFEQNNNLMRIDSDLLKLGPLFIIQILPFSGPLFMLYMYTYPGSVPSWFMIDYYHDRHEQLKVQNQQRALKHFQELGLQPQDIKLDQMSLRDLRKICLLLFGIYRDGTVGYRKLSKAKIPHLFAEGYSRFLIKRYMEKMFKRDLLLREKTDGMGSLDEIVRWKYEKIMNGEYRFEHKPMHEKTLDKMMSKEGQESEIFRQIQEDTLKQNASGQNKNSGSDKK